MENYYSVPKGLAKYAEKYTTGPTDLLYDLERETHLKLLNPQMLSGHYQGRLLIMLSLMIKPKKILEIGTFTGYSALCLAEGLQDGGILHTIEFNEELEKKAQLFFDKSNRGNQIKLHIGDACEIIPGLDEQFDLVFIDANKKDYQRYFDLVIEKVKNGGFIIADNVLWYGKVMEDNHDKETAAIHAFNEMIHQDSRVENALLPVRDGIMVVRKL